MGFLVKDLSAFAFCYYSNIPETQRFSLKGPFSSQLWSLKAPEFESNDGIHLALMRASCWLNSSQKAEGESGEIPIIDSVGTNPAS